MKKSLFGLAAVTLAVGAMVWSTSIQARPDRPRNVTWEDAESNRTLSGVHAWTYSGTTIESTGFEAADGWNLGFMCDPTVFTNCLGPPLPAGCSDPPDPLADGNCCATDPNPNTGWYMSITTEHCGAPWIDTENPGKGEQHMRFATDGQGNPAGCVGYGSPCRVNAFTPADPTEITGPTTISYMVAQSLPSGVPPWGSSFLPWFISDTGTGGGDTHYFSYYGVAYFYDYGFQGYYGLGYTSGGGAYDMMTEVRDPCNDSVCYTWTGPMGGTACQSQGAAGMAGWISRAIIMHDNNVGAWDFDNYVVDRGDACPTYCDGQELEPGEDCDPPADETLCPGFCRPAGDPDGECTCIRPGTCEEPLEAFNGDNTFLSPGGYFKYTADTPYTGIDLCNMSGVAGFDTKLYWDFDCATGEYQYFNDDCDPAYDGPPDINAPCYGNLSGPSWVSCLNVPTTVGQEYVFVISGATGPPPPLGETISFTITKKTGPGEPIPNGACCNGVDASCIDNVPVDQCVCDQCLWHENKLCSLIDCVRHTGACCDGETGICVDAVYPEDCVCEQCDYFKGETCDVVGCVRHAGACCDGDDGSCVDGVYPEDCVCDQCTWSKGELCADIVCEEHTGACCDGLTGVCTEDVYDRMCTCPQCVWHKGDACIDVSCNPAMGACCDHDSGTCTQTTMAQCACEKCDWTKATDCAAVDCWRNFTPIPTVSEWGLAILALLLLVGAKIYFSRRHAATA